MDLVPCHIRRLIIDERNDHHVVDLRPQADDDQRHLLLVIGPFEAMAIDRALRQEQFPRPLTHDLLLSALDANHASIQSLEIQRSENGTYFAELVLKRADAELRRLDCRPSDGLALLARSPESSLLINQELLEED
ncbi:MAG: bifunctional nuclease family protein [Planctomycetota bacterium]